MNAPAGNSRLSTIVIVGGGSAGWMTAAALGRYTRNLPVTIRLVESDEIGTIGVGEASIPLLEVFNRLIGLSEREFILRTQGTFKLGIEFVDWARKGHRYLHPFTPYGQPLGVCDFHQYWLRAKQSGYDVPLEEFNLNTLLARAGHFNLRASDTRSPMSIMSYAYHFDAGLYARFLRSHAEAQGIQRTEGRIVAVDQHAESGFITGVRLASGEVVAGDFFIDCTGFRGLLIEDTLKAGFIDWSSLLPCDRAVAVPSEPLPELPPFTQAAAREAGWQWRIPLRHRTGNGYVYSGAHLSDDEATHNLLSRLNSKPLADPRLIHFRTGRRAKAWVKNCVAIGLSAGFLEPLESTSIHLIQMGVTKLLTFLPTRSWSSALSEEFNRQTAHDYEDVRDFLCLHYKATEREDTPFWRYNRHNTVSDTLAARMEVFKDTGRVWIRDDELFKLPSWVTVMRSQGIEPKDYDPMADAAPLDEIIRGLNTMRDILARTVAAQPLHAEFLRANLSPQA